MFLNLFIEIVECYDTYSYYSYWYKQRLIYALLSRVIIWTIKKSDWYSYFINYYWFDEDNYELVLLMLNNNNDNLNNILEKLLAKTYFNVILK